VKSKDYNIILASKSPRRRELLESMGYEFKSISIDADESYPENLKAEQIAVYISEKKAAAYDINNPKDLVICSDTIVWNDDKALGKPENADQAEEMLKSLSGKKHQVISAITIRTIDKTISEYDIADVYFKDLSDDEIKFYIDNFKPFDKAGAYGIQEWIGMIGIEKIEGSYFTVMGLPTHKLYSILEYF
jgi:septum formation protein